MNIDILVAEIGSTTTMVNAFSHLESDRPRYIGQGVAPTTVMEGDVRQGLKKAIQNLAENLGVGEVTWDQFFATSSAAGGLRMTVHGLANDMTVRAAREAALGAGANIHQVTAGKLTEKDLDKVVSIHPNIILLVGGVDYGDRDTALHNAGLIAGRLKQEKLILPIIYAGNIANHDEVRDIFSGSGQRLSITENVYPRIDDLNIEPTRAVIQKVFEEHITGGPGMEHVRELVDGSIIPTPGAVLLAAKALRKEIGDLCVIDVGGATTDIHSVTNGNEAITRILIAPEPEAKRTVEGDLGTYVNRLNVFREGNGKKAAERLGYSSEELIAALEKLPPIPQTDEEIALAEELTASATMQGLIRHMGRYRSLYGPNGKKDIAEGKDLTDIRFIIATGGALTRLPGRETILKSVIENLPLNSLAPPKNVQFLFDTHYIMASLGVLSTRYPDIAVSLLKESLSGRSVGNN